MNIGALKLEAYKRGQTVCKHCKGMYFSYSTQSEWEYEEGVSCTCHRCDDCGYFISEKLKGTPEYGQYPPEVCDRCENSRYVEHMTSKGD
jgi:hypothetical protein